MPQSRPPVVTLMTDFGTTDHYVGTMKGVICNLVPGAILIDISHEIPGHDISAASFLLQSSYHYFPTRTIHLCVIDPGVGSSRRNIIVSAGHYLFVAPDNGILSGLYDREKEFRVFDITSEHFFLKPVSKTFHGRDIFAPVAAWLARGVAPSKFGREIEDPVRLEIPKVKRSGEREFHGAILHVDRFGNLVSNFPHEDMEKAVLRKKLKFTFQVGTGQISQYRQSYSEGSMDEIFAISGSSGYVEFSKRNGSASETTGASRGDPVRLLFG